MKPTIIYDDFAKLDLRIGEVAEASVVEGSEKLLKLTVNFGSEIGVRTIFAGIKKWYTPSSVKARKLVFITNLLPKKFKINGQEFESQGMLLAADGHDEAALYTFDKDPQPGTKIR
ncbi:methionine--tRNA ligase [Patescibacteria group bacterium]|nr:methionine--tRNA ligase [Patescibacteria group bacterium]